MLDLKADAAAVRAWFGLDRPPEIDEVPETGTLHISMNAWVEIKPLLTRLADMVDRLTDTEGLAKSIIEALGKADDTAWIGALQSDNPDPLQSCCLDGSFNMIDAAQAVQDYARGKG